MATKALVFVGNLAFQTTDEELSSAFAEAGKVLSANIITRGRRSLGYGFVEFENMDAAQKAVNLMNKKEIAGRPINVEIAKPREELPKSTSTPGNPEEDGGDGTVRRGGRGRGRGRGGFRGGFGGARRFGGGGARGGFRRGRGRGGRGRGRGGSRPPRPVSDENRPLSKTTLFVANLPFTTEDAELSKLFDGHNVKAAHVVKMRNGRSRGYGFVEFHDEGSQQKALAALDGKEVEAASGARKLSVKVAMQDHPRESTTPVAETKQ